MPTKYAILGAAGQLGREITSRLQGDVHAINRADVDVRDENALATRFSDLRPNIVINCTAYNLVDKAEDDRETAFAVNAWALRSLAKACAAIDATLVHFSTDYVFGLEEDRTEPYVESDAPGPISVYGMSKLLGEYCVRANCPKHYVIRTCGLYGWWGTGGKGGNFVETMLKLASQGKDIRVVDDQQLTPSSAGDVAVGAIELVGMEKPGLYHLTNHGDCTWYAFAHAIFELAGVKANLTSTTSAAYGAKARRPHYSVLRSEYGHVPRLRHWREVLADYLQNRPTP